MSFAKQKCGSKCHHEDHINVNPYYRVHVAMLLLMAGQQPSKLLQFVLRQQQKGTSYACFLEIPFNCCKSLVLFKSYFIEMAKQFVCDLQKMQMLLSSVTQIEAKGLEVLM